MRSPNSKSTTSTEALPSRREERPRRSTPKGLVWLLLAAIAAVPFPWWW